MSRLVTLFGFLRKSYTSEESIEALRRKMLIAGAAGLHERKAESGQDDPDSQAADGGKDALSGRASSGVPDTEKTIQS